MIGLVREIFGTGTFFGIPFMGPEAVGSPPSGYTPILLFIQPPGAFLVLAFLIAIMNKIKSNMAKKGKDTSHFGEMAAEETAAAKEAEAKKTVSEVAVKADDKPAATEENKEEKEAEGKEEDK